MSWLLGGGDFVHEATSYLNLLVNLIQESRESLQHLTLQLDGERHRYPPSGTTQPLRLHPLQTVLKRVQSLPNLKTIHVKVDGGVAVALKADLPGSKKVELFYAGQVLSGERTPFDFPHSLTNLSLVRLLRELGWNRRLTSIDFEDHFEVLLMALGRSELELLSLIESSRATLQILKIGKQSMESANEMPSSHSSYSWPLRLVSARPEAFGNFQ